MPGVKVTLAFRRGSAGFLGLIGHMWVMYMCGRERHGHRGLSVPKTPASQRARVAKRRFFGQA